MTTDDSTALGGVAATAQTTPAVSPSLRSHVYNIEPPANASEYLHRAGRSGRIGSTIEGAGRPCGASLMLCAMHPLCSLG